MDLLIPMRLQPDSDSIPFVVVLENDVENEETRTIICNR